MAPVDQINTMACDIDLVAVVSVALGPTDLPQLPKVMEVADRPTDEQAKARPALLSAARERKGPDLSGIEKVRRFPKGLRG